MPNAMAEYVAFAEKAIALLVYIEQEEQVNVPFGAWQGGQYSVEDRIKAERRKQSPHLLEQIIDGVVGDLERKGNGLLTTALLVGSQVKLTVTDGTKGLLGIFTQPRPIIRDLKRVYEIDVSIGQKIDELWMEWHYFEALQQPVYEQLNQLTQQQVGGNHLFASLAIKEGSTYADITEFIMYLNEKHKAFLQVGGVMRFGDDGKPKGLKNGKIKATFAAARWAKLKEEYLPARQYKCNKSWKNFTKNIKNIGETFKWWAGNEFKKMTDAVKRLGGISFKARGDDATKKQEEYLDREYELMQTLYGLDVKQQQEWILGDVDVWPNSVELQGGLGLGAIWRKAIANSKKSKEEILAEREARKTQREQKREEVLANKSFEKAQRQIAQEERQAAKAADKKARGNDPVSLYYRPTQGDLVIDMTEIMHGVTVMHEKTYESLLATQPTDLTDTVWAILQQVRIASNHVSGDESEEDLLHYLGQSCDMQCSNLWGSCWDG